MSGAMTRLRRMTVGFLLAATAVAVDADWRDTLSRAGNAEEETVRLALFEELARDPGFPPTHRTELGHLTRVARHWAKGDFVAPPGEEERGENGALGGFFFRRETLGQTTIPVAEDSPLYPLHCLYRGRMLVQTVIQSTTGRVFEDWIREGRRLLEIARAAYPENRIVGMYLDTPIRGWPVEYAADPRAPEWANFQRESLEKLADVIHWWIDNRQAADGSFGGGWGDDVEMWRSWVPVLLGFEDPLIAEGQERLGAGILTQPHMAAGYSDKLTDVEHGAEDSTDTLLPMMHLRPDDPEWAVRCSALLALARERWMAINERGTLQFKSTYFSASQISDVPAHACETPYHVRPLMPVLLHWQRTRDGKLTPFVRAWLDTWVDALRADRGKPEGVLPAAIRWPTGGLGGVGPQWFEPQIDRQAAYNWPRAMGYVTNALLLAHWVTGDPKYLSPIERMVAFREDHRRSTETEPGSPGWCAAQMDFLDETLAKYRSLFGDSRFDNVLARQGSGYTYFRLTGDMSRLTNELKTAAEAFRVNWPSYTGECRWTDRVFAFWRHYNRARGSAEPLPVPDPRTLYSSVTGDLGYGADVLPLNAVRWLTPPREIAALVTSSSRDGFEAQLFHFGEGKRSFEAELFVLRDGLYRVETDGTNATLREIALSPSARKVNVMLAPGELTRLRVTRVPNS